MEIHDLLAAPIYSIISEDNDIWSQIMYLHTKDTIGTSTYVISVVVS